MRCIVVLIVLALKHYFPKIQPWGSYWFSNYIRFFTNPVTALLAVVLPTLLIFLVLHFIFGTWLYGILVLLIDIFILWYCLNTPDLETSLVGVAEHNISAEQAAMLSRRRSEKLCVLANEQRFAVIFWFLVLGGFGAVLYRFVNLLRERFHLPESTAQTLEPIEKFYGVLNWIPSRLSALSYILAGEFLPSFTIWSNDVWSGKSVSNLILTKVGLAASGFNYQDATHADLEENRKVLQMLGRAEMIWVGLVIILLIGSWIV